MQVRAQVVEPQLLGPGLFLGGFAVEEEDVRLHALRVEDAGGQAQQGVNVRLLEQFAPDGLPCPAFNKEPEGLLRRRDGEADEEGVEVFEHLPPEAVEGAMAFVGDDEVEGFDGNGGVVGDFQWSCSSRRESALISAPEEEDGADSRPLLPAEEASATAISKPDFSSRSSSSSSPRRIE